jgi:RNase H-like domain found in reverse transcriptase/Reverse transcriptase (RNA-dependent DNA polymerase)/Integrase zinc binding domain
MIKVNTANGPIMLDKFVTFNPFPNSTSEKFKFFVHNFSNFFDGIISNELLTKIDAVIHLKKQELHVGKTIMPIHINNSQKKQIHINAYETQYHEIRSKNISNDVDFLISKDIKIADHVYINEGIYRITDEKCYVAISNKADTGKAFTLPSLKKIECNFENVFPMSTLKFSEKQDTNIFSKINHENLNDEERKALFSVLQENVKVFYNEADPLTFTNSQKHQIKTIDDAPSYTKTYRYPHCFKQEIQNQIKDMLRKGIIRHSDSPWNSPVWVVPKKPDASGKKKFRLVIDYRRLNARTIQDRYPIPNICEILDKLGKACYFTTLDLASGFHQIEIDEKDIPKTAFSVDNGHYEFLRMPFGLRNAPSTFQRVMDNVLKEYIGKICLVYLDDIIIFSTSLQEHKESLAKILERLKHYNLKIQVDKCDFFAKNVEYLGHIVTREGVKPNPSKIEAIKRWPLPKNEKQLKGFLGVLGYYRRFIKDFAKIIKPLTAQLRKGEKINHSEEFIQTFEKCKNLLMSSDVLAYPDFSRPFNLTCDASKYAISGILSQGPIGKDRPVAFASRTLSRAEENYSVIEKEFLAIVWACKYFRPYLFGTKFFLFTDHKPLTYIFSMKDSNGRLMRWRLALEEYDYEIKYRAGSQNVVADGFSRIPPEENTLNHTSIQNNVDEDDLQTVHSADEDDSFFIPMSEKPVNSFSNQIFFKFGENSSTSEQIYPKVFRHTVSSPQFSKKQIFEAFQKYIDHGRINCISCPQDLILLIQNVYNTHFSRNHKIKIVISQNVLLDVTTKEREEQIIESVHEKSHRGINENFLEIIRNFYFPQMKGKIRKFIGLCKTCKRAKYERKPYNIKFSESPIPKNPLEILHIDIYISTPNLFISAVDKFSKFGILIPIKSRTIVDVRKGLIKLFSMYGPPKILVSDNEPSFKSAEIRGLLESLNIEAVYTPSNFSEVNGIVERFHSTISEIFRCIREKHKDLTQKEIFKLATLHYNTSIHSTTNLKPIEVFLAIEYNKERKLDIHNILQEKEKFYDEIMVKLKENQKNNLERANKNKEDAPDFDENEEIYVARQGIKSKTKDKFTVSKVKANRNKTVMDEKNKKIHKMNLRRKNN